MIIHKYIVFTSIKKSPRTTFHKGHYKVLFVMLLTFSSMLGHGRVQAEGDFSNQEARSYIWLLLEGGAW